MIERSDLFGHGQWLPAAYPVSPPPFSFVEMVPSSTISGRGMKHGGLKPSSTVELGRIGISGPFESTASSNANGLVLVSGYGIVKYGDSSVTFGDVVGPKPNSWEAWKGRVGARVVRVVDTVNKLAMVRLETHQTVAGEVYSNASYTASSGSVMTFASGGVTRKEAGVVIDQSAGTITIPNGGTYRFSYGVQFHTGAGAASIQVQMTGLVGPWPTMEADADNDKWWIASEEIVVISSSESGTPYSITLSFSGGAASDCIGPRRFAVERIGPSS